MLFFISEVKISLQISKFPGNKVPEFPIFSRHEFSKLSTILKNDLIILKQIVWESSKMAFKF